MPDSPQSEYSYAELIHYLDVSRQALRNFEERYYDLGFSYVHPELLVSNILDQYTAKVREEIHIANQYLEVWEQDTVSLGSISRKVDAARVGHLLDRVKVELKLFEKELDKLYKLSIASVRGTLLNVQLLTADFTAERIDKHNWHKDWVAKQEQYLIDYFIREAGKFEASKELTLKYIANTNDAPEKSGVYFLFHEGEIIYIGHSSNLLKRLGNHDVVRKYYCKDEQNGYNVDCVYAIIPTREAKSVERYLISVANPVKNRQGKAS